MVMIEVEDGSIKAFGFTSPVKMNVDVKGQWEVVIPEPQVEGSYIVKTKGGPIIGCTDAAGIQIDDDLDKQRSSKYSFMDLIVRELVTIFRDPQYGTPELIVK
jgi:hypothetical protein